MKKSDLRSFVRNIYFFAFFNALMVLMPVYAIFFQENGVSDVALTTIFMMWAVGVVAAQLPSVWLNRQAGQKWAIAIGQFIKMFSFVLWFVWPTYWGFALGMVMWGVQGAIYNISYESLLYDELAARKHKAVYAKVLGHRMAITTMAGGLSAAGSLLLYIGYDFILFATLVPLAASLYFISRIKIRAKCNPVKQRVKSAGVAFWKTLTIGSKMVLRNPCVVYMTLLCTMVGNLAYLDDYFGPMGLDIGVPIEYVGGLTIFLMICKIAGQMVAHKMYKLRDVYLYGMIMVAGLTFIAFAWLYSIWALAILGVAYTMFSIIDVATYAKFQESVPEQYRPVALSLFSISNQICYAAGAGIVGFGAFIGGWWASVAIMGTLVTIIGLWSLLFVRKRCAPVWNNAPTPGVKIISSVSPSQF
ncbi:MAG: MFS transporter [Alphaproteobacteria bacterium]|nr:MFS transporter [Alphaproteobacteria bacterium]